MKKQPVILLKSHIAGYTRKDGVFVKEHDDSRQSDLLAGETHDKSHPDYMKHVAYGATLRSASGKNSEYPTHGETNSKWSSSHAVKAGKDAGRVMSHAHAHLLKNGFKEDGHDILSGSKLYKSPTHTAEVHSDGGTVGINVRPGKS